MTRKITIAEAAVQAAVVEGITPLEVMLRTMRSLWKDAEAIDEKTGSALIIDIEKAKEAMAVAASAAPYCHARIAPKEWVPPQAPPSEHMDIREAARRISFVLEAGARMPVKALPNPQDKEKV